MKTPIEEIIIKNGYLSTPIKGTSMLPLLESGNDTVIIEALTEAPKVHDVILFKLNDKYILHRVIKAKQNNYTFCGDNRWKKEYHIKDGQLVGIMTGYYKGERYVSVDDEEYKKYVKKWCIGLRPFRKLILKSKSFIRKIKKYK